MRIFDVTEMKKKAAAGDGAMLHFRLTSERVVNDDDIDDAAVAAAVLCVGRRTNAAAAAATAGAASIDSSENVDDVVEGVVDDASLGGSGFGRRVAYSDDVDGAFHIQWAVLSRMTTDDAYCDAVVSATCARACRELTN
jgi:hypothetical protein